MADRIEIEGSCHCGDVTYHAFVESGSVSICHCTDCQELTGSAFRVTVSARREDVSLTGGQPSVYVETGECGGRRHQAFCPKCGSPVYVTGDRDDPIIGLRWGGIRQRGQLVPTAAIWCSSAVPWLDDVSRLPGSPRE
jgi:hypothetical protein